MKWIKNIFETEEDKEINDLIVNGQPHWLAQVIVDQRKVRREKFEKHSKTNHVRRLEKARAKIGGPMSNNWEPTTRR